MGGGIKTNPVWLYIIQLNDGLPVQKESSWQKNNNFKKEDS
jgi:hypothetical protein